MGKAFCVKGYLLQWSWTRLSFAENGPEKGLAVIVGGPATLVLLWGSPFLHNGPEKGGLLCCNGLGKCLSSVWVALMKGDCLLQWS